MRGTQDDLMIVRRFPESAREGYYMPADKLEVDFSGYYDADIVVR